MRVRILYFIVIFLFFSCSNEDEEKLKSIVTSDISIGANDSIEGQIDKLDQYQEVELNFNKKYVSDLENLINSAYNKQLEHFEDEELGFFAGYGYMFSYLFGSKQGWEDEMRLKSGKYFGSLNIEQDAYTLFESYQKDVSNLRKRFWDRNNSKTLPFHQKLNLPDKRISLGELTSHSRNNIVIEIISEGLEKMATWLIYPFIVWALSLLFPAFGKVGCIAKIIVFIITIILSAAISMWNDNRLIEKLREQNKEQVALDYQIILKELNNNTRKFYEND